MELRVKYCENQGWLQIIEDPTPSMLVQIHEFWGVAVKSLMMLPNYYH